LCLMSLMLSFGKVRNKLFLIDLKIPIDKVSLKK
jgi:hypothetical protein